MSDSLLYLPIVYAGRTYMVRPGSRRAKHLERAAIHYGMRDYANANALFRMALRRPDFDPGMPGYLFSRIDGSDLRIGDQW